MLKLRGSKKSRSEKSSVHYLLAGHASSLFIDMHSNTPPVRNKTKVLSQKMMKVHRAVTISSSSCQLSRRKSLIDKRRRVSVYTLVTALFGIIIMLLENELTSAGVYTKIVTNKERPRESVKIFCSVIIIFETITDVYVKKQIGFVFGGLSLFSTSIYSITLKTLISVSTVILLSLILAYHALRIKLFLIDNCANDWRIAMTWQRTLQIFVELTICAIHPIPGEFNIIHTTRKTNETVYKKVSYDIILSVPMFLRLFLVCRTMLLHFKTFRDVSSQSISALNRINFDIRFLLKTLMIIYPGTSLLILIISLWGIAAWTLRQCERFYDDDHINYVDAIWLIIITFLTIGYGDVIPKTYCGRSTVVFIGMMSTGCAALLVAVISKKLELTKTEHHVHNFLMNTQLKNMLKNAAANLLRERWLIYKYTNLAKVENWQRVRIHQRNFYKAIYAFRQVKQNLQKLMDNTNALKVPRILNERLMNIEEILNTLQAKLETLSNTLSHCTVQQFESMKQELNCIHSDIMCRSIILSPDSCLCQKPPKVQFNPML